MEKGQLFRMPVIGRTIIIIIIIATPTSKEEAQ
jgi:hypothetical protein